MADYVLATPEQNGPVIRRQDNAWIPNDPANRDYAEYLEWVDEGNAPDPYQEPEPLPPPPENLVLFDHEVRLRDLEGKPVITLQEFIKQRGLV